MKTFVLAAALCLVAGTALAETATPPTATCKASATEKKLAGAALASFMKKCRSDATKACSTSAAEKKLVGAAKTSFTKKCLTDAVGS